MTLHEWIAVISSSAFVGLLTTVIKGAQNWWSGKNARRLTHMRDSVEAFNQVGAWQDAYWAGRAWCRQHHTWTADDEANYPKPPTS